MPLRVLRQRRGCRYRRSRALLQQKLFRAGANHGGSEGPRTGRGQSAKGGSVRSRQSRISLQSRAGLEAKSRHLGGGRAVSRDPQAESEPCPCAASLGLGLRRWAICRARRASFDWWSRRFPAIWRDTCWERYCSKPMTCQEPLTNFARRSALVQGLRRRMPRSRRLCRKWDRRKKPGRN